MSVDAHSLLAALSPKHWQTGPVLAEVFGVSRAAVHKRLEQLRANGWPVESAQGVGYKLSRGLDLLDSDALADAVPALSVDAQFSVASTSDHLLSSDYAGPRLCLAEQQTAGRGRRGRQWQASAGENLTLSLDWRFENPQAPMTGLSPAVAVMIVEALGVPKLKIKWPNDLVVSGPSGLRKLGGILIDAQGEAGGPMRVVIGLGLNIHMRNASIDQPWAALSEFVRGARRTDLCIALAQALLRGLPQFEQYGLPHYLPAYALRDVLADGDVTVQSAKDTTHGRAIGLAADGGLRLKVGDAVRTVYAGDVSVRAA